MAYMTIALVALRLSGDSGPGEAELRAQAEARAKDRAYADAGEVYVKLAGLPGVERRKELLNAHTNFEAAYLTLRETRHLCRALSIAEQVVREDQFKEEQMEQFWRERVDEDLERLRTDAIKTRRLNCRFGATGAPRPSVPLLADGEPPPTRSKLPERPGPSQDSAPPRPSRRYRAHTAAGASFTGLGIGFLALCAGAVGVQVDQVQAIRRQIALVEGDGRLPTPGELAWASERKETALAAQAMAIGAGTAGVVSLATGIALLKTRHRYARPLALRPYGGLQGAGLLLRGQF